MSDPRGDNLYERGAIAKPPLGILPERLWLETRAWDLIEVLARHRWAGCAYKHKWMSELRVRLVELKQREDERRDAARLSEGTADIA